MSVFLEEESISSEDESDTDDAIDPKLSDIFIQRFQAEVLDQIRIAWNKKKKPPRDAREDPSNNPWFLLVDDIDILWANPATYHALEAELANFRAAGWRVAATTRVLYPLRKDALQNWWVPECDTGSLHEGPDILDDDIWWLCKACQQFEHFICGRCRSRGHGCIDDRYVESMLFRFSPT